MTDWPNLFVVGAPRCGTTSLWAYLGQHPDVFMAGVKEPHFFSGRTSEAAISDRETYLELFAGRTERWRGEASPSYFWHEAAAPAIRAASPKARIIISLRDPIDRAFSMHAFRQLRNKETRPFAEAVRNELARDDEATPPSHYVGRSRYAAGVRSYLDLFGGGQVRVLIFEEFVAATRETMADLFSFLDLDPSPAGTLAGGVYNSSSPPRNKLAALALDSEPLRRLGRRLVPASARTAVENSMVKATKTPEKNIDPDTRALLRDEFVADRAALEKLLGREVPWP